MNKELSEKLANFWDDAYKESLGEIKPSKITNDDLKLDDAFSKMIVDEAGNARNVLDFGCGLTFNLFFLNRFDLSLKKALGIDPSLSAVSFLNESAKLSNINKVSYQVGGGEALDNLKDEEFDYEICSNVLDCVPTSACEEEAKNLVRLLANGGTLFLKVNFFLDENACKRSGMEPLGNGEYASNGLFRIRFKEDQYWIDLFKGLGLTLLKQDTYQRVEKGPADRVFVFKK